ncbi:MAG: hypothetical protein JW902_01025, partial [Syntrophaceae bacterium]|nr:hypothetical protein [Syntrophaceae bacterium]
MKYKKEIIIGRENLTLEAFLAVARDHVPVKLSADHAFRQGLRRSVTHLKDAIHAGVPVYGVST